MKKRKRVIIGASAILFALFLTLTMIFIIKDKEEPLPENNINAYVMNAADNSLTLAVVDGNASIAPRIILLPTNGVKFFYANGEKTNQIDFENNRHVQIQYRGEIDNTKPNPFAEVISIKVLNEVNENDFITSQQMYEAHNQGLSFDEFKKATIFAAYILEPPSYNNPNKEDNLSLLVCPLDNKNLPLLSVSLSHTVFLDENGQIIETFDFENHKVIDIAFDGIVAESYPGQISNVYSIKPSYNYTQKDIEMAKQAYDEWTATFPKE